MHGRFSISGGASPAAPKSTPIVIWPIVIVSYKLSVTLKLNAVTSFTSAQTRQMGCPEISSNGLCDSLLSNEIERQWEIQVFARPEGCFIGCAAGELGFQTSTSTVHCQQSLISA